jgi:hypothetical protein
MAKMYECIKDCGSQEFERHQLQFVDQQGKVKYECTCHYDGDFEVTCKGCGAEALISV